MKTLEWFAVCAGVAAVGLVASGNLVEGLLAAAVFAVAAMLALSRY